MMGPEKRASIRPRSITNYKKTWDEEVHARRGRETPAALDRRLPAKRARGGTEMNLSRGRHGRSSQKKRNVKVRGTGGQKKKNYAERDAADLAGLKKQVQGEKKKIKPSEF